MRGVSLRAAAVALLVLVLATPAVADSNADPGLWAQFVAWIDGRIDIPIGGANDDLTFDEWLVLMGRIGIPIG